MLCLCSVVGCCGRIISSKFTRAATSSGRAIVASGIAACSTLFIVGSGHGVGQCWLGIVPKIKKIPIKHGFIARNHKLPQSELFCSVLVKYNM